jgi:hypothetical protein
MRSAHDEYIKATPTCIGEALCDDLDVERISEEIQNTQGDKSVLFLRRIIQLFEDREHSRKEITEAMALVGYRLFPSEDISGKLVVGQQIAYGRMRNPAHWADLHERYGEWK